MHILEHHNQIPLIVTEQLREQSKGDYEGKLHKETALLREKKSLPRHRWKPKNGESMQDVWHKQKKFLEDVTAEHQSDTVLIVGHGGPIYQQNGG